MKYILSFYCLLKKHWPRALSVVFFILLSISYARIFAIGSPYAPGATLDPACAPGDTNCIVSVASIPSQTGNTGKFLTTNGTTTSWTAVAGGGLIGSTSTVGTETWLGTSVAGMGTASTTNTTFIGINAGKNATNATNSIFIGNNAGLSDTVDNTVSGTSILIGDNTSTGGFSDSIAIGAGAINTSSNQFTIGASYTGLSLGGIDYAVPYSQGTANSVLTNDGSGGLSWGTISMPSPRTAGDSGVGYLNYNGIGKIAGQFYGGTSIPSNTTRLNYDGSFYVSSLTVSGNISPTVTPVNNNAITTVDSALNVGQYSSIALGSDGFARIAYLDLTNNTIKFAQCTNADCTTKNITTIDNRYINGGNTSIAMGADGFARITYAGNSNNIKFVQCTNADCTTNNITVVTSTSGSWKVSSLVIGSDGFARIVYDDNSLKFVQCTNASCSTKNISTIDALSPNTLSIALASDGFVRIAYTGNNTIKFAQCTNADCTTSNITTVDSTVVSHSPSISIGSDGFARIAYAITIGSNYTIKFAQCTNTDCTTNNKTTIDNNGGNDSVSLALGSDGFARITYYSTSMTDPYALKFAQCTSADCATNTIISTIDTQGIEPSITIGSDGFARIAYADYHTIPFHLKFIRMNNIFTGGSDIGSSTSPFHSVYSTYLFSKQSLVGNFDLAENYPTKDSNLTAGYIVSLDKQNPVFVSKGDTTSRVIGIVSTMPGSLLGGYNDQIYANEIKVPIALSGRVPVKVNLENGPIAQGDDISLSSTLGVGKKAKPGEDTVGIALESYDGTQDSILVFVHLQTSLQDLNLKVKDLSSLDTTSATSLGSLIKQFLGDVNNSIADLYAKVIHSDKVETKELCVGSACVTENQFLQIINKNITAPDPQALQQQPTVDTSTTTDTTTDPTSTTVNTTTDSTSTITDSTTDTTTQ